LGSGRISAWRNVPQGGEGVCNYARQGSASAYGLVFCSTGARAGSVVSATEVRLRILGWRYGAAARATLRRIGCQPNVPTLPAMTAPPAGYRGIDSAGFLQTRLPLVSTRTRALAPAPSDWELIPAGQPGPTNALLVTTGLWAGHPLAAASLGKQSFVFAVGAGGRVLFQTLDAASLGWGPSWSEVPGGLTTDRRVAATATKDTLFLFARDAGTGSLRLNKRKLACSGGTGFGCWSGWGAEARPVDYGPSSFAAASGGVRSTWSRTARTRVRPAPASRRRCV
jgi:hypothetical protein